MKIEKIKRLKSFKIPFLTILSMALILTVQGHCIDSDDVGRVKDLDGMTNQIRDFLFGPVVRKIGLTLGMGAGLIQAFVSGSIRPLLIYGGLGLVVGFLPALIEKITTITG